MVTGTRLTRAAAVAPGLRVLIVGGGASGVLLAAHLLRRSKSQVAVTILEKGAMLGCGVAYSTSDPQHLLNTRASNMSAHPDDPEHFLNWLRSEGGSAVSPHGFVPRATYGHYLKSLLDPWAASPALTCWHAECLQLDMSDSGVTAHLANGERIEGDLAVLATGHALPGPSEGPGLSQPWDAPAIQSDGDVLMVGSGLTMVDQVLSLLERGHKGRITAVSRRGLLPQVHQPTIPVDVPSEALPSPMRIAALMRWLREQVREREAQGGDWRDVVDGLRPHLQAIWRDLPLPSRRSFLRHASSYWEVHRHRMPPSSFERITQAQDQGRFRLLRGRYESMEVTPDGSLLARIAGPDGRQKALPVRCVIDCRGIRRDPERHATPLVAHLLAVGAARVDSLRLGLDVGPDCAVRDADGAASGRLFALGPASRAAFWEITAIPDIRSQAAGLAERILQRAVALPGACESVRRKSLGSAPYRSHPRRQDSTDFQTGEEYPLQTGQSRRDLLPEGRSLEWPEPLPSS